VFLALIGTCGPQAQIVMSSTTSSTEAMSRLTKVYANWCRTRIMSLKERLSSITKGDSNVYDYFRSICSVADELVLIGHSIDALDLVIMVLNDLGPVYHEFCETIHNCDTPLLFDELFDKFVDCENFLLHEERQQLSFPVTTKHVFHSSFSRGHYKHSMPSPSGASPARGNTSNSHPRNSSSKPPLICQYCDRRGHTAKACYKLHSYPSNHSRSQANMVNKDSDSKPSWLLDSGASHNVIGDLANLILSHDYTGNDKLVVPNGKGLTITRSGSTSLPLPPSLFT